MSERLAFVRNNDQVLADIYTGQEVYGRREKVRLSVVLRETTGDSVTGNMSVSVTDNGDLSPDSDYTIFNYRR